MDFLNKYFKYDINTRISGLTKQLGVFYLEELFKKYDRNIIVLTSSLYEANNFYNILEEQLDDILFFPMDDFLSSYIVASSPELKYKRLETLNKLKDNKKSIIVTNLMGYLKFLPSKDIDRTIKIKINDDLKRDELQESIESLGYKKESLVTSSGEYAVRGFIVDIYPIDYDSPIRIEFDGNTIDSIRVFDPSTQMTFGASDNILIKAIDETLDDGNSSLFEYADKPIVVYIDESQINASNLKLQSDIVDYQESSGNNVKIMHYLDEISDFDRIYLDFFQTGENNINAKTIDNYNENFEKLQSDYENWINTKCDVTFYLSKAHEIEKIKSIIPKANIINKKIDTGFILDNHVIIGENDIEQTHHIVSNYKNAFHFGKKIKSYNQIENGDYVVHISNGIGIYRGISTLKVRGAEKDFLTIEYDKGDKIYIPVEKIDNIYKYTGKDGVKPKLNSLNSANWEKTKKYVTEKAKDISLELIKLYQERMRLKKNSYKDFVEEEVFASEFPYKLTKDQEKAINEISADLKRDVPMDRLICGDVAFGKTEVALRAMFKTVLNNEQVLYLCPTTILSKQQYNVAKERFKNWPVEIALLNRHLPVGKAKKILQDLKDGKIDILFGTHRILSNDIECKKLGLLVVDEEQRFGVTHKEKIKKMKTDVNVLTLSATPIPRTLKMAMSSLRDLSIIDTPPINRYPIQTYVVEEDDFVIKDAIYKELSRNGQIFILYNRVETIEDYVKHISSLVPDAKINFAHGKMEKNELEKIMQDFVDGVYDILVCTTIIESGIDVTNVNTLIIHDAENFGLSQLYQIRGRVGRGERIAYAYLMYQKNKMLNDIAIKRLNTIKEFTELGSGYKIAMRDLSIRGSGDLFGASQSGFVDAVGVSLFMKMVEDEIRRQNGEEIKEVEESKEALLNVDTHIDNTYVDDEDVVIEIHQKINEIDSYEKLISIKEELEDRFGMVNEKILVYMYEEWFEKIAQKYNIKKVLQTDRLVEIRLPKDLSNNIKGDKLLLEAMNLTKHFNISYQNGEIIITLYINKLERHFIYYVVELLEKIL